MSTLAAKIKNKEDYKNSNIVKVETYEELNDKNFPTAINFERIINQNIENIYHHLGIYCYSVDTLQRFINLSQSEREKNSKLEQVRALDNGIKINVSLAKNTPIGVDTMEDYMAIKKILEYKN